MEEVIITILALVVLFGLLRELLYLAVGLVVLGLHGHHLMGLVALLS